MKLLDIRNNLAKISYDTNDEVALGKFVALTDKNHSYVAQIVNLKADINCNFAVAKLIFTFSEDGIVDNYDGTIPSLASELSYLNSRDILQLLPIQKPITLGKLAQQNDTLRVDETLFEKNLLICAEKFENICTFTNNSVAQLSDKTVVIDTDHTFTEYKSISFKKNFKLPLNSKMIDYIYENDLEGVSPTSKAVIQEIFQEVREYSKTVANKFIPFDKFVDVVSAQYEETAIPELALLKQKLLKYREENIFAQTLDDINAIKKTVLANNLTYIDLADTTDSLQKELIEFIHEELNNIDSYLYCFVKLTNKNSDKKLLRTLLDNNHIFTTITCSHNYKYVSELKQKAENIIFFAPQTIQHDFASYNTFLSKLNSNEFVVYGALTQNVPFIVELSELSQDEIDKKQKDNEPEVLETKLEIPETSAETLNNPFAQNTQDLITNSEEETLFVNNIFEENTPNTTQIESTENLLSDDVDLFDETQTTYESTNFEEDLRFDDDLIEQVAKDVDKIYYTANTEEIPSVDDFSNQVEETLTENDLDLIEEMPLEISTQEDDLIVEDLPTEEVIEETEYEEEKQEPIQEDLDFTPTTIELDDNTEELPTLDDVIEESTKSNDEDDLPMFQEEQTQDEFAEEILSEIEESVEELPIYETEEATQPAIEFAQGDTVTHPKYGTGVVEKLIKYGNKTLCSISFEEVGRRLLDPSISELQKVI